MHDRCVRVLELLGLISKKKIRYSYVRDTNISASFGKVDVMEERTDEG